MQRFRHACVTGNVEELMAVLHADATLVADGGGKALAVTRPVLGADHIAEFVIDYCRQGALVGVGPPARHDQRRARSAPAPSDLRRRHLLV